MVSLQEQFLKAGLVDKNKVKLANQEKSKQKKVEEMVKGLKSGDKVIINPGIYGTIVGVEDEAFQVRIDDKTKIKVLKSAVSGLQGSPLAQTEKK